MALNINGTTGISGVDGSVSAPALTGTDSNTGITFPSADTIKFSTGGVERMSITNSGISGITSGITMADQWRISTSYSASSGASTLTANWERNDTTGFTGIGSAMTQSSGIFSFPSTGIYLIRFYARGFGGNVQYAGNYIQTGISGTYTTVADSFDSAGNSSNYYFNNSTETIFDVTNTSTHTVRFAVETSASVAYDGNSAQNVTYVTFMRLGDT